MMMSASCSPLMKSGWMFDKVRKKSAEYGFCVDGLQSEFVLLVKTVGHQIHIFEFAERQIFDMCFYLSLKRKRLDFLYGQKSQSFCSSVFSLMSLEKLLRVTETLTSYQYSEARQKYQLSPEFQKLKAETVSSTRFEYKCDHQGAAIPHMCFQMCAAGLSVSDICCTCHDFMTCLQLHWQAAPPRGSERYYIKPAVTFPLISWSVRLWFLSSEKLKVRLKICSDSVQVQTSSVKKKRESKHLKTGSYLFMKPRSWKLSQSPLTSSFLPVKHFPS